MTSYGLLKSPIEEWGWTYFQSTAFRMMNDQGGFTYDDLQSFVKANIGIFKFIPKFLQGPVADDNGDNYAPWPRYLAGTVRNLRSLFAYASAVLYGIIIFISLIRAKTLSRKRGDFKPKPSLLLSNPTYVIILSTGIVVIVLVISTVIWNTIENLPISKLLLLLEDDGNSNNNNNKRIVTTPWKMPDEAIVTDKKYVDTITAAQFEDVLISDRLHHPTLYNQSRWIDYHPANRKFVKKIYEYKNMWMSYRGLSYGFMNEFLGIVIENSLCTTSRILKHNPYGDWTVLDMDEKKNFLSSFFIRLWTQPYTLVPHGGIFWEGLCAYRTDYILCNDENKKKAILDLFMSISFPYNNIKNNDDDDDDDTNGDGAGIGNQDYNRHRWDYQQWKSTNAFAIESTPAAGTPASSSLQLRPYIGLNEAMTISKSAPADSRMGRQQGEKKEKDVVFQPGDRVHAHAGGGKRRRHSATVERVNRRTRSCTIVYDMPAVPERHEPDALRKMETESARGDELMTFSVPIRSRRR